MLKVEHCSPRSDEDTQFNQVVACNVKEEHLTNVKCEEDLKKGICWFELQRTNMAHWTGRRGMLSGQHEENNPSNNQLSSCIVQKDEDGEAVTAESLVSEENRKRKCPLEEVKPTRRGGRKKAKISGRPKAKKCESSVDRWSAERYKQAEQSLLEILKAEGAVFGKPITRPQLRAAGRKRIGDTGLLDHLLKHIDGKVAPGGTERFRRWHNTDGIMEYWLESADLENLRREAGQDPFWVPPSWWKPDSDPLQQPVSSADLKLLQEEMANMKRVVEDLVSKKKDIDSEANVAEDMHKEFVNWKAKTGQRLVEISSSLAGMQDMYRELITWKVKTEQQLTELSNSLSSMQALTVKQDAHPLNLPAQERWEDWLDGSNLDSIQGEDIEGWLVNEPINNPGQDIALHDPYSSLLGRSKPSDCPTQDFDCVREMLMLKEEMAKLKSDMKELVPKKQEEVLANCMQGAPFNVNPKLGLDDPWALLQEMIELVKWKPKMEQQLMELSNAVSNMQTPKQLTAYNSPSFVYDRIRG